MATTLTEDIGAEDLVLGVDHSQAFWSSLVDPTTSFELFDDYDFTMPHIAEDLP